MKYWFEVFFNNEGGINTTTGRRATWEIKSMHVRLKLMNWHTINTRSMTVSIWNMHRVDDSRFQYPSLLQKVCGKGKKYISIWLFACALLLRVLWSEFHCQTRSLAVNISQEIVCVIKMHTAALYSIFWDFFFDQFVHFLYFSRQMFAPSVRVFAIDVLWSADRE